MVKWFSIVVIAVLLDRLLKGLVESMSKPVLLAPNAAIVSIHNTGAVFGLGKSYNFLFILLSFLVLVYIFNNWKSFAHSRFSFFMISLIVAGIMGNLWDRLTLGYVVDFISISWWPAFNFADSCLVIGIIGLVSEELYKWKKAS